MSDDETTTTGAAGTAPGRRTPRFGTVFWGVVLLVFAVAVAVTALPWFSVDPTTLVLGACIVGGALLVVAGAAALVARGPQRRRDAHGGLADGLPSVRDRD